MKNFPIDLQLGKCCPRYSNFIFSKSITVFTKNWHLQIIFSCFSMSSAPDKNGDRDVVI